MTEFIIVIGAIGCAIYVGYRIGFSKGWKACIKAHFQPKEGKDE